MSNPVVTSQPTPSAPLDEKAMAMSNGIATEQIPPSAPPMDAVVTQPTLNSDLSEKLMYAQTEVLQPIEVDEEEAERRRQRNADFCCFACADSCADDPWCWYIMCRMYCQCLGICCENCANCLDSCGEGCANCLHGCCESDQAGNNGCCSGDGNDDCCTGGAEDAGCCDDCDSCDCDCGGCFD